MTDIRSIPLPVALGELDELNAEIDRLRAAENLYIKELAEMNAKVEELEVDLSVARGAAEHNLNHRGWFERREGFIDDLRGAKDAMDAYVSTKRLQAWMDRNPKPSEKP